MSQIKVELQGTFGSDRQIAEAAWTSSLDYQKKQTRSDEDVKRVVEMLARDKHSTPFESVVFRFWIKMPIATDRQHVTHRIATHNGMSGRYRTMPDEFLAMPQDVKEIIDLATGKAYLYEYEYNTVCEEANKKYRARLVELKAAEKAGLITNAQYKRAREFLRGELPQHNMTERTTIINLRSFANYQKLRNSEHAQPEIKEVAQQMLDAVKASGVCPIALAALEANGWQI